MNTQSTTKINSVIIIGGGAAGMLAAISASELGKTVTVIEKNKFMGKKLNITGKGRCNITNNCEVRIFLENVPVNPKFLYRALTDFSPSDTINFFESNGLETKTERGRRVFPLSDKAFDVTTTLQKICAKNKVKVIVGEVFDLIIENNVCIGAKYKSNGETRTINGDAVILATGGASYPKTGSDGFGYELARRAGHTIVPIKPSLVPLESVEKYCAELMGLSLKNVKISFFEKEKLIYSDMGEMLFTHFGVSGPMILSASAYIKSFPVQMNIDLKPALDERTLENRIINDFLLFKNKVFENSLDKLLPKAMIPVFVRLCGINARKEVNSITKEERREIVKLMKCFPITIKSARPIDEAVITSGGVSVSEINPSSMQSKIAKNLYFAGEIIDVDAYTGGYNLQIAFSTGHLAGKTL